MRPACPHPHGRRSRVAQRLRRRRHRDVRSGPAASRKIDRNRIGCPAVQEKRPPLNLKFLTSFLPGLFLAVIALCAPAIAADRNALTFTAYDLQATITPS